MNLRHLPVLVLLGLLATTAACAQGITLATALKAAVLRADETRLYATLAADTLSLDDLLTPDCRYVHSNGKIQSKAEFLGALKGGVLKYSRLQYTAAPTVRLLGSEAAVLTGTLKVEATSPTGTLTADLLVTVIYVVQNDRWQMTSYQSTLAAK